MAEAVQRLSGIEQLKGVHIFGVRHLSPASAVHLLSYLDALRPRCVLIEGPSDCGSLLAPIASSQVRPPIALLAYTVQLPVRTILYPFADYSPEYQAICWASRNKAEVRFIDLPASASIGQSLRMQDEVSQEEPAAGGRDKEETGAEEAAGRAKEKDTGGSKPSQTAEESRYSKKQAAFYAGAARLAGEYDYDTFWERQFEHCPKVNDFRAKIAAFSSAMRESLEELQWEAEQKDAAYNLVREAYMKRQIKKAIGEGYEADQIVVVTGAYHVKGLQDEAAAPMTDSESQLLPALEIKATLMPYSYYRLSTRSGYGAGNKAPAYFQLMWECLRRGDLDRLAPLYLSSLAKTARSGGFYHSTAHVIEAVRLAKSLAAMHDGTYPALKDLHDAAVCLLGGGELAAVAEAMARVDIGTAIGKLPEGLSQTSVQDDMNRQLRRLRLEKYKSAAAQDLELDLRENRKVQSKESAYIDLNRSTFLHRLQLLEIGFAELKAASKAERSSWREQWVLQWTAEHEIEVVEAALKGETIETAAAFVLKERLEAAGNMLEIAALLEEAYHCMLLSEIPSALLRLQTLCVEGESFVEAALTARSLARIIQYRDVRSIDTAPLVPVLQQVFLRAVLVMFDKASCDDEASDDFIGALSDMHAVSQEQYELVNDELWLKKLRELAGSDSRNPKISGAAAALLMERNAITDDQLKAEVTRRLSCGVPGELAALWFEGLSVRNRWALLSRVNIFRQLDEYLQTLSEDEFRRALVFLRRAFASFEPKEKNTITDILADLWQIDAAAAGEFLQEELSEDAQNAIDELNDFDFEF